jgi:hypothetical protein
MKLARAFFQSTYADENILLFQNAKDFSRRCNFYNAGVVTQGRRIGANCGHYGVYLFIMAFIYFVKLPPPHTPAGFDLVTHNSAGGDDTTTYFTPPGQIQRFLLFLSKTLGVFLKKTMLGSNVCII